MSNFEDLINKYYVQIPIIQRDYVQGGKIEDIKQSEKNKNILHIRNKFLKSIAENLDKKKDIYLDFIYGSIIEKKQTSYFIPIDGQQRLTTIFLLYWYFGKKEGKDLEFLKDNSDKRKPISRFSYETRTSSRDFINFLIDLIDPNINLKFNEDLEIQIKDNSQFIPYWEYDPTIKSMFVMINTINDFLKKDSYYDKLKMIKFKIYELEKFGLDDDLYIKMNARGKQLSEFEKFKSNFEGKLNKLEKPLADVFKDKIENEWHDYFWKYKDPEKMIIDNAFMNYFTYITEMLSKEKKIDNEKQVHSSVEEEQVYSSVENVKFLFKTLDLLSKIEEKIENLFSIKQYTKGKVALFPDETKFSDETNILKSVIDGKNITLQQEILLFIAIRYIVDFEDSYNPDDLHDLVRVARNLMTRNRELKRNHVKYTPILGREQSILIIKTFSFIDNNIYKYLLNNDLKTTNTGISTDSLNQEKRKARLIEDTPSIKETLFKLEDNINLKGDLTIFLELNKSQLEKASILIPKIYDLENDALIARAMLTIGNYQFDKGHTAYERRRKEYFGRKGFWEIILTQKKDGTRLSIINELINNLNMDKDIEEQLKSIISSYLDKTTIKDWKYYFIKYESFLKEYGHLNTDKNIFVTAGDDSFEFEKIIGGATLNAKHVNPFINEVGLHFGTLLDIVPIDGRNKSYLIFKNDMKNDIYKIYIKRKKWIIEFSKSIEETQLSNLMNKFKDCFEKEKKENGENNNTYSLIPYEDKDFIETMIDFIKTL